MKARRLIEGSAYEPQTLQVKDARTHLAHACLIVYREDSEDAERIKIDALQVMTLAYRTRIAP